MRTKLYCVRDTLAGIYGPPAMSDNDATMIRDFGDIVRKGNNQISEHPSDFVLVCIGEYDRETGALIPCDVRVLAHATDFVVVASPKA